MRFTKPAAAAVLAVAASTVFAGGADAQDRRVTRDGTIVTITPRSTTIAGNIPTNVELVGRDYHRNRPFGNTSVDLPGIAGSQSTTRGIAIPFHGPLGSKGPGER